MVSILPDRREQFSVWVGALRPGHWVKNLLVFLPVVGLGLESDAGQLAKSLLAFACLSLAASCVYLLNDVWDRKNDSQHPRKRARAIASGRIKPEHAVRVALGLGLAALLVSVAVSWPTMLVVGLYQLGAIIYGLFAKRLVAVDIVVLSALFLTRVFAGSVAAEIPVSQWLFVTAFFAFLGLAASKRIVEIQQIEADAVADTTPILPGRGYQTADREALQVLGVAASFSSAVLLSLFIHDLLETIGGPSQFLWVGLILWVSWLSRFWILVIRGAISRDPIVFVSKDVFSLIAAGLISLIFLFFG